MQRDDVFHAGYFLAWIGGDQRNHMPGIQHHPDPIDGNRAASICSDQDVHGVSPKVI